MSKAMEELTSIAGFAFGPYEYETEARRLYNEIRAEVLREAISEMEADHEKQGGEASGQYSVGMRRCMLLLRRMAEGEGE